MRIDIVEPELKSIQEPNAKSSTAIADYICYKLFMHNAAPRSKLQGILAKTNKNAGPLLTLHV